MNYQMIKSFLKRIFKIPEMEDIDFLLNININNSTVYSLDFSPDEKYIAFCLDKGEILIFSL